MVQIIALNQRIDGLDGITDNNAMWVRYSSDNIALWTLAFGTWWRINADTGEPDDG